MSSNSSNPHLQSSITQQIQQAPQYLLGNIINIQNVLVVQNQYKTYTYISEINSLHKLIIKLIRVNLPNIHASSFF